MLTLLPLPSGLKFWGEDLNRLYLMAADSVFLPNKAIRESTNSLEVLSNLMLVGRVT